MLKKVCQDIDVELKIVKSDIKQIVFDERKEKNPCSLCANLRRGMLNSIAKENRCNKIALGHNEDDVLETFLMNMIYAGNISVFSPIHSRFCASSPSTAHSIRFPVCSFIKPPRGSHESYTLFSAFFSRYSALGFPRGTLSATQTL